MKRTLGMIALLTLAACAPPQVTAFNGDSVTVRTTLSGRSVGSDIEAEHLCLRSGKPQSEFLSSKPIPNTLDQEHLYACLAA